MLLPGSSGRLVFAACHFVIRGLVTVGPRGASEPVVGSRAAGTMPGRRLMQKNTAGIPRATGLPKNPAVTAVTPRASTSPPTPASTLPPTAAPKEEDLLLETSVNRTVQLLAMREQLLQQVAQIDRQLETERDSKRRALTAKYERELRALDDEAAALTKGGGSSGGGSAAVLLREVIDEHEPHIDLPLRRGDRRPSDPHVDVHDIDIDVVLNHIDTDHDGVVTHAEVQKGAAVMQLGAAVGPMVLGSLAGVVCYLICRFVARKWLAGTAASAQQRGRVKVRPPAGAKAAAMVGGGGGGNNSPLGGNGEARMRRKHGEHGKQECGPAIAC